MSFVLNLTSRGAGGRAIVRARMIAGDVLTIGRDPASDIHLTDLEVTRRHAEIRRLAPDRVELRALASLPLIVDGRSIEHAEIDPTRGADIRIGETRIVIGAGEAGAIAIAVTRNAAPIQGADEAAKRFSIAGRAWGKRPMAWVFGLAILAIFLIWPIWSFNQTPPKLTPDQLASGYRHIGETWSSGPLSRAHAKLARNCKVCHTEAFVAVPDTACRACHTTIDDHADPHRLALTRPQPVGRAAFERSVAEHFGRMSGRCVDCHSEHSGPQAMPAALVSCTACHADLKSKLPDTALGNASDFARHHPQFAPKVMTTPGDYPRFTTISLDHPGTAQNSGLRFPHALHMSRSGGVARMQASLGRPSLGCAGCHAPDVSGARFKPVEMERNCAQCHSLAFDRQGGTVRNLPHGDAARVIAFIRASGARAPSPLLATGRSRPGLIAPTAITSSSADARVRAAFSPHGACADCHIVLWPSQTGNDYGIVPVREQLRFMPRGRFDHKAHAKSSCASCHREALTTDDPRVLMLPGIATCRQCHGASDATGPKAPSTCVTCHGYHHGTGTLPVDRRKRSGLWAPP